MLFNYIFKVLVCERKVALGIDRIFNSKFIAGISLGVSNTDVELDSDLGSADKCNSGPQYGTVLFHVRPINRKVCIG